MTPRPAGAAHRAELGRERSPLSATGIWKHAWKDPGKVGPHMSLSTMHGIEVEQRTTRSGVEVRGGSGG
jgi:hypothetical protein